MALLQLLSLVVSFSLIAVQPWSVVNALVVDPGDASTSQLLTANPNGPSSKGNEFFIGFIGNNRNAEVTNPLSSASLFVTTDEASPVSFTVEYFGTTVTDQAMNGRTTLISLPIGRDGELGDVRVGSENVNERNKGIRIKASGTSLLSVYGINDADVSTDAFLALPFIEYPNIVYRYYVFSTTVVGTGTQFESRFLIVGSEDDTTVTVRPTQTIEIPTDLTGQPVPRIVDPSSTNSAVNTGTFTLDQLETIQFHSGDDLTGTIIESNKPVSVFVGHECGQIPSDSTACDHLVEQVPPDATWGTQFFTVPLDVRESGERYRVGTGSNNNLVTVTCTIEGQMPRTVKNETIHVDRGMTQYVEFDTVGDDTNGVTPEYRREFCCIETSKPAIVMMYSKGHSVDEITLPGITGTQGDPFMLLIPPLSQYSNNYTITSAKQLRTDFVGHISYAIPYQFFDNSVVDQAAFLINSTAFNPTGDYYPIYCANQTICGYGAYSDLQQGDHIVQYAKANSALNLYVYGFLREISFAYPAGFEMEAIGVPRITIFDVTVFENVGTIEIPINRTGGDLDRLSVIRATSRDGTAVAGSDYVAQSDFRIRWRTGEALPRFITAPSANDVVFQFTIMDDDIPEDRVEYFEIDLSLNPQGNGRNGYFFPDAIGRVTILDDDIPPQIGFDPTSYTVDEDAGEVVLQITTSDPTKFVDATGALFYTDVTGGTATSSGDGADFTETASANAIPIIFPAGVFETTIRVPITDDNLVEGTERFFGRIRAADDQSDVVVFAPTATVDIIDNDRLIIGFEETMYTFSESVGTAMLGVRLSPESGQLTEDLVFTFTTDDITATAADDYASSTAVEYTFSPGDARLDIPVNIVDDSTFEDSETFFGTLMSSQAGVLIDVPMTTVEILDNDLINIGFEPVVYSIDEDAGYVNLTFVKFDNPDSLMENITVFFSTADGSAVATSDYTQVSDFEVTFAPNEVSKTVQVEISDDSNPESLENFFGNLVIADGSSNIAQITVPQATINVMDDDELITIGFEPVVYNIDEDAGFVDLTFVKFNNPDSLMEDITVVFSTADGSAVATSDYTQVSDFEVTFAPNEVTKTVRVEISDDSNPESLENFFGNLVIADGSSNIAQITVPQATVNVMDNDELINLGFEPVVYSIDEDAGFVDLTFVKFNNPDSLMEDITVVFSTADGSAVATSDYTQVSDIEVTFAPNEISKTVRVEISDDSTLEPLENFFGNLVIADGSSNIAQITVPQATINVMDDDEQLFVSFVQESYTFEETDGTGRVCVNTSGAHSSDVTVTVQPLDTADAVSACGTPQAFEIDDFTPGTLSVTFPASSTSATLCVDIPLEDNSVYEGPEHFLVRFTNLPTDNTAAGAISETCVTILDPEDEPCVNFTDTNIEVSESDGTAMVCVTLMGNFEERLQPLLVTIGTTVKSGATDMATGGGVDYESANFTLMFNANDESEQVQCAQVNIIDDMLGNEKVEQFSVRFISSDVRTCSGNTDDSVCISITDNDKPVAVWEDRQVSVNEGDPLQVCFNTDIGSAQDYTIDVAARAKGTNPATEDVDYEIVSPQSFLVEVAPAGTRYCVAFTTEDDSLAEGLEQFEFYFVNLPNDFANTGDPDTVGVDIIDDDIPEVNIPLMMRNISVPEPVGEVEICIELSTGITEQVVVTAVTGPKSGAANQATADSDYSTTTLMLTFEPSGDGQTVCGNVSIIDDLLGNEPNELFSVTITEVSGDTIGIGAGDESCVEIIDNDVPVITWEEPEVTIPEGGSEEVCFTSDIGTAQPYQVRVGVRGKGASPATQGDDYTLPNSLEFSFTMESGERFCVDVNTMDDTLAEGREQFELFFDVIDPTGSAERGEPQVVCVNIEDNDELSVSFAEESYTAMEDDGTVQVCFMTSSGHPDRDVAVTVQPVDTADAVSACGTPQAFEVSDFTPGTLSMTFPASSTSATLCVDIPLEDDTVYEGPEHFLVRFTNIPNDDTAVGAISETCVTILDPEDEPCVNFTDTNIEVSESDGTAMVCVTLMGNFEVRLQPLVVTIGTAVKSGATDMATGGGVDYESANFTLMFNANDETEQVQCAQVNIIDDLLGNEKVEQFSVQFISSDVRTCSGNTDDSVCVSITDNDTPNIKWEEPEVTIPEGNDREVCFTSDIGTAQPYQVRVGFRVKGENPAQSPEDYSIPNLDFTVPVSSSGGRFCVDVNTVDDTDLENMEQFELYFETISPTGFATPVSPEVVCVNIEDDDEPPVDKQTCEIVETLQVRTFSQSSAYRFTGTCEHIATSFCESVPGLDVRVTIDFLTDSEENGAVGLHINDLRYVSREDGTFDDGDQTPSLSSSTRYEYEATSVVVNQGDGMTNITYSPSGAPVNEIEILHIYGGDNPTILISVRPSNNVTEFCGLCGSRSGDLLKADGSIVDRNDVDQTQEFARSYIVEPSEQILRPQRKECGTIRNDTVIGDPLYAAPVYSEDGKEYSLCYEVRGRANTTLNLVSDTCVSVNARYSPMDDPELGNIISSVGVRAKGDGDNSCHNIRVDLDGCSATIDSSGGASRSLSNLESFEQDGISVRKYPRRVRIAAPNCENVMLVMWVICENRNNQDMIKFVIARGVNLRASSHGLLGQFWNVPLTFTKFNGTLRYGADPSRYYVVTIEPGDDSPTRSFLGQFYHLKWDKSRESCLYVGNSQAGSSYESEDPNAPNDSIIEGRYKDYIMINDDLFGTDFAYNEFEEDRC